MRDRFTLPVRFGGGDFRPTMERAQFPQKNRNVATQFLEAQCTWDLWPLLDTVSGACSFKAEYAATRWGAFYAPGGATRWNSIRSGAATGSLSDIGTT